MLERLLGMVGYERRSTLASPGPDLLEILGVSFAGTSSGVSVSSRSVLRSPTALAAIRTIVEAIEIIPVHVFRRQADGSRRRERDHPAARLLAGDANPWTGGPELRATLQLDALREGVGYAQVVRVSGQAVELHRLAPGMVTVELDDATGEPAYLVQLAAGGARLLTWSDVVAVATPGSVPGEPVRLVHEARESIALELITAEYTGRLFGNGARPSGILRLAGALSPEAVRRLRASWDAAHAGGSNAGRTAVLESGTEFQQTALTSTDAQLLELRKFAVQQIAGAFRVPLPFVGDLERAVWRNLEQLTQQLITFTLEPWFRQWRCALERVLLAPEERDELFVEHVTDAFVQADLAARFAAFRQAVGGAWLTRNEARELDNRPPLEGADELILQAGQAGGDAAQSQPRPNEGNGDARPAA
ncbi:MAG: phage portal protein [Geminicoccaceae bacterium]